MRIVFTVNLCHLHKLFTFEPSHIDNNNNNNDKNIIIIVMMMIFVVI